MDPTRLPSFKQIYHLTLLAEVKHFQKAADKAGITQSTLSASIKQLEKILGVVLLERSGRSMSFTKEGQLAAEMAESLLEQGWEFVDKLDRAGQSAELRIGLMANYNSDLAIKFLQAKQLLGSGNFQIVENHAEQLTEAFLNRELQAAVMPFDPRLQSYRFLQLYTEALIPLAPEALIDGDDAHWDAKTFSELPFVELNNWSCLDMAYGHYPFLEGLVAKKFAAETPTMAQAKALEAQAWTLLPASYLVGQSGPSSGLRRAKGFLTDGAETSLTAPIVFVCHTDQFKDPQSLEAFEKVLANSFAEWAPAIDAYTA